jgi:DNA-binding response OmpR family regulator
MENPMSNTIYITNHDSVLLELYAMILEEEGYLPIIGPLGPIDTKAIAEVNPDLIILDHTPHQMGEIVQTLQKLKLQPATAHTPIIVATTLKRLEDDVAQHFVERGIRVIAKPFEIHELLSAVRQGLRNTTDG